MGGVAGSEEVRRGQRLGGETRPTAWEVENGVARQGVGWRTGGLSSGQWVRWRTRLLGKGGVDDPSRVMGGGCAGMEAEWEAIEVGKMVIGGDG